MVPADEVEEVAGVHMLRGRGPFLLQLRRGEEATNRLLCRGVAVEEATEAHLLLR
jgi:hypothetical protein